MKEEEHMVNGKRRDKAIGRITSIICDGTREGKQPKDIGAQIYDLISPDSERVKEILERMIDEARRNSLSQCALNDSKCHPVIITSKEYAKQMIRFLVSEYARPKESSKKERT